MWNLPNRGFLIAESLGPNTLAADPADNWSVRSLTRLCDLAHYLHERKEPSERLHLYQC